MRRDEWTPAMQRQLERLSGQHVPVRLVEDCLACTLDNWAARALVAARDGLLHRVGRVIWRDRPVAVRAPAFRVGKAA